MTARRRKPKIGRPPAAPGTKRDARCMVNLTPAERERVEAVMRATGLALHELVMSAVAAREVAS